MRSSFTLFALVATSALALPAPYDDGKWAPGKYEGGNTGFDNGQYGDKHDDGKPYIPEPFRYGKDHGDKSGKGYDGKQSDEGKYHEKSHNPSKRYDDGSWYPGKYEGPGTPYNDGKYPRKYEKHHPSKRYDDGSWYPGKYEGPGTPYDDGKWYPGKYEGPGTPYDDGKYSGKYEKYPKGQDKGDKKNGDHDDKKYADHDDKNQSNHDDKKHNEKLDEGKPKGQ